MNLFQGLSTLVAEKLEARFHPYEVRNTLLQLATRWDNVLTDQEKRKVARTLGGNRYAKVSYEMLDVIFKEVSDGSRD